LGRGPDACGIAGHTRNGGFLRLEGIEVLGSSVMLAEARHFKLEWIHDLLQRGIAV
jgi:hypothetical protein